MLISELFETLENGYPWEWRYKEVGLWIAVFNSESVNYDVTIAGKHHLSIQFASSKGQGITGTGNAFKVLATVSDILKKALHEKSPDFFAFAARKNQPSRVKLFRRLAKMVALEFPDYDLDIEEDDTRDVSFYFSKKEPSLTEVYNRAPKYWYRGVETVRTSNWKVPDRKLPEDLLTAIEGHRSGHVYALYNHQFKVSKSYSGMSNWGFGVYVTNSIDWAARYGNNILVCTVDPEYILHITHKDFVEQNPTTNGGKLAIMLESEVGPDWADQAKEMFRIVKKIDRKAKALFVQTDELGNGQMCVFNKNYIDAKYFFEINTHSDQI